MALVHVPSGLEVKDPGEGGNLQSCWNQTKDSGTELAEAKPDTANNSAIAFMSDFEVAHLITPSGSGKKL
jgi:hypothetical protein